jgi:hypothetical protein
MQLARFGAERKYLSTEKALDVLLTQTNILGTGEFSVNCFSNYQLDSPIRESSISLCMQIK